MRTTLFYVFLLIVVGTLICLQSFVTSRPFADASENSLSPFQDKQLEMFRESNALLTTLATAVFAAIGAIVFNRYKEGELPAGQRWRAILSAAFACLSIYWGYVSHELAGWMLQYEFFNLMNPRLVWAGRLQFWMFIGSLLILGQFFYSGLQKRDKA